MVVSSLKFTGWFGFGKPQLSKEELELERIKKKLPNHFFILDDQKCIEGGLLKTLLAIEAEQKEAQQKQQAAQALKTTPGFFSRLYEKAKTGIQNLFHTALPEEKPSTINLPTEPTPCAIVPTHKTSHQKTPTGSLILSDPDVERPCSLGEIPLNTEMTKPSQHTSSIKPVVTTTHQAPSTGKPSHSNSDVPAPKDDSDEAHTHYLNHVIDKLLLQSPVRVEKQALTEFHNLLGVPQDSPVATMEVTYKSINQALKLKIEGLQKKTTVPEKFQLYTLDYLQRMLNIAYSQWIISNTNSEAKTDFALLAKKHEDPNFMLTAAINAKKLTEGLNGKKLLTERELRVYQQQLLSLCGAFNFAFSNYYITLNKVIPDIVKAMINTLPKPVEEGAS